VVTNAEVYAPGASDSPFESTDFSGSQSFCAKCTRNQHLFTSSLASYFPPSDDPTDSEYERGYEQFRRNLEDRYPQVCESCEPVVKSRIRRAGYEAKSDHLRRMMDQSRANRESRQARNRSWRSLLLYVGAFAYWASIAGQLAWNLISVATISQSPSNFDYSTDAERPPMAPNSVVSCVSQSIRSQRIPSECSPDLAPTAGLALIAGALSLWWNPKLRMKIDGMPGKFGGLAEYYQAQLVVIVARCVFWAIVKDPSASGLEPELISAFHALMMGFTILVSMSFSLGIPGAKLIMVVGFSLSIYCQLLESSTRQLVRQQLGNSIRKPQGVFFCTARVTFVGSHHKIWRNTKGEHWWITAALSD
jgi:hypothetical protein